MRRAANAAMSARAKSQVICAASSEGREPQRTRRWRSRESQVDRDDPRSARPRRGPALPATPAPTGRAEFERAGTGSRSGTDSAPAPASAPPCDPPPASVTAPGADNLLDLSAPVTRPVPVGPPVPAANRPVPAASQPSPAAAPVRSPGRRRAAPGACREPHHPVAQGAGGHADPDPVRCRRTADRGRLFARGRRPAAGLRLPVAVRHLLGRPARRRPAHRTAGFEPAGDHRRPRPVRAADHRPGAVPQPGTADHLRVLRQRRGS